MKPTTTESTSSSANALSSAARNCTAVASDGTATGPCATSRPQLAHASAASAPSASELVTTAMRGPDGSGWWTTSWATSNSWWTFSTRMTPDWRSISSSASRGSRDSRTVWPGGTPNVDRPDFTTMTGLERESRRAMRENLRGLPMLSR